MLQASAHSPSWLGASWGLAVRQGGGVGDVMALEQMACRGVEVERQGRAVRGFVRGATASPWAWVYCPPGMRFSETFALPRLGAPCWCARRAFRRRTAGVPPPNLTVYTLGVGGRTGRPHSPALVCPPQAIVLAVPFLVSLLAKICFVFEGLCVLLRLFLNLLLFVLRGICAGRVARRRGRQKLIALLTVT